DAAVSYAVTGLHLFHLSADLGNNARCLLSVHKRERGGIASLAEVHIDEVHAGSSDLDHGFVGFWSGNRNVGQGERFRASGLLNLNGFHSALILNAPPPPGQEDNAGGWP